ncbi:hypothetical protein NQD34_006217, partial [Periophthalmus magnuspinnatus]
RKPSDVTDDGESELQGLVSNILDEAVSQDSLYSNGLDQCSNNIWSPKILRDELLQYFQPEAKTQSNSNFALSNYTSLDAVSKPQGQAGNKETENISAPPCNGLNTNQQMLFNLPNVIQNSFSHSQKPPPGLQLPPVMANSYLQLQPNNYENGPLSKDRANGENIGNFSDFNHVFRPQNDTNGSDLFYKDHYNQLMDKPATANKQYTSQDLNQLVSSFLSFVTSEQDNTKFANVREDNMTDTWESPDTCMQTNRSAYMQGPLVTDFGIERTNGKRNQLFKRDSLQDLSTYNLQNSEYPPQQNLVMGNHNKILQRDNTTHSFAMNDYQKHQVQQSLSNFKPQMQKEKKRMADYFGDTYTIRHPTENFPEEKRPALSQSSFYDQPQRFNGENNMIGPQFRPLVYAGNDPRRRPNQIPNPNFSSRGSLVYRGGVPNMDMTDMMSTNEMSQFTPGLNGVMDRREGTYHCMSPTLIPTPMTQGGPVLQLYFYLDKCYEQWKSLEKERKKTEIVLSKTFLGKRTPAVPNSSLPKTPPNPTRVDHLIVAQMREQARVSSLFVKMEYLSKLSLSANIYSALSKHNMAIYVTSARRKEEILHMSQSQREHFTEDRDTMMLMTALKDLAAATRKLRTAVLCALQMTLPKPVPKPEPPICEEEQDERGPAPSDGYSYRL